jgi:hypothetical protein
VPDAIVPADAVDATDASGRARQSIGPGEIVTAADVSSGAGPGSLARDGMAVVPVVDRFGVAEVGADVHVVADGVVLADGGRVVGVRGEFALVEVPVRDAPTVAAATGTDVAALVYLP